MASFNAICCLKAIASIFLLYLSDLNCTGNYKVHQPMPQELQLKFAIADDHKIFRDGIKMALNGRQHLKCIWEVQDGKELMHKLMVKQPDVL